MLIMTKMLQPIISLQVHLSHGIEGGDIEMMVLILKITMIILVTPMSYPMYSKILMI